MSTRSSDPGESRAGFTLIEMLVVMSILGLLAYVAFPNLSAWGQRKDLEAINRQIGRMVQLARLTAIQENSQIDVLFDLDVGTVTLSKGARILPLPKGIRTEVLTGTELVVANSRASIAFFPDGSSSGGEVRLRSAEGKGSTLRINWLTGNAAIEPAIAP